MRLREMKEILSSAIPKLKLEATNVDNNIQIKNCALVVDTLLELEQFNFLKANIEQTKTYSSIFTSRLSVTTVESTTYSSFARIVNQIMLVSNAVIIAIDQIIPEQNEFSISVKLPEINDLKELIYFTEELDTCLSQVLINSHFDGKVQLQNFESGSNWFEIIVGSLIAAKAVKDIVICAVDVKLKMMEVHKNKQNIRAIDATTNVIETVCKGLDKQVKELCDMKAKTFIDNNVNTNNDNEYFERVSKSIKIMAELLIKGTEVHLALNAPHEIKKEYPDFKKLNSNLSEIKQITNGESTDNEES